MQNKRARGDSTEEEEEDEGEVGGNANMMFAKFDEVRSKRLVSVRKCPLCTLGFKPGSMRKQHKVVVNMQIAHDEHSHFMPPEEEAIILIEIYNRDYREPEVERGNFNVPVLKPETVVEHIRHHMFSHVQTLDNSIQDLIILESELRDTLMVPYRTTDRSSRLMPVLKNGDFYLRVIKQKTATITAANALKARSQQ